MAREELVSSADPSVASAPLDKKISFLQSKNLTKEEIDIAFLRAGEAKSSTATSGYVAQQTSANRHSPLNQNYAYAPGGQWQSQLAPPELPRRDWRDWFIMATVVGGVGYGLYAVAKRYIVPLIAPPTPPQLQQDKEHIDEQFSRAFALLDQLSSDTSMLKAAEDARTEKLDAALQEVEDVVGELKSSSRRRDEETRRISEEVRRLKDAIPTAIEGSREGNEKRLKELGSELKSLKILLGSRLGPNASTGAGFTGPVATNQPEANGAPADSQTPTTNSASTPTASTSISPPPALKEASKSPFASLRKPASIPAWQMAAANKPKNTAATTSASTNNVGESSSAEAGTKETSASPS
ncbi:peroxisomal membrane protein pex14 [Emydomyces testavorans]|uniref:Peroxisomal membrane protein PEX14 n=1 Tax=Emydomyces testavorans TaxID=2070801 RepID=A0AAF0DAS8_9EURO|nr:peroxisomal membrane protein pex14 [Emydomyces testavorans]